MAGVKTPEERGPLGAWAYDTRVQLGVSPEQVVKRLGRYDAATIRKAEADGRKNMSRPLWRALVRLYPEIAREQSVTLDPIPLFPDVEPPVQGDMTALVQALQEQTAAIGKLVEALSARETPDPVVERFVRRLARANGLLAPDPDERSSQDDHHPVGTSGSGRLDKSRP